MYLVIFLFIISILYIPFVLKYMKKKKAEQEAFASANPTAAKVYTKLGLGDIFSSEAVTVVAVNDGPPTPFYDGIKEGQGFFVLPGKSVIDVEYARTRPGILHKTVTTRTGITKQEIDAQPGKRYRLGFNREGEHFVLEEI